MRKALITIVSTAIVTIGLLYGIQYITDHVGKSVDTTVRYCVPADSGEWYCSVTPVERKEAEKR